MSFHSRDTRRNPNQRQRNNNNDNRRFRPRNEQLNQPSYHPSAASSSHAHSTAAPLYITIGPPCSGKSTFLRQLSDTVVDICLDEQEGVYLPLPFDFFVDDIDSTNWKDDPKAATILPKVVRKQTIKDRILASDQAELRGVCQFLQQKVSKDQLTDRVAAMHRQENQRQQQNQRRNQRGNNHNTTAATAIPPELAAMVVSLFTNRAASLKSYPETVDLFCRQVLFQREDNNSNEDPSSQSALDRAYQTLRTTTLTQAVAWGNTNLRASDYQQVLQIAADQGRPVQFCVFDAVQMSMHLPDSTANSTTSEIGNSKDTTEAAARRKATSSSTAFTAEAFDLGGVKTFPELFMRNVDRFLRTGRYIPSTVMWDMTHRSRDGLRQLEASIITPAPNTNNNRTISNDNNRTSLTRLDLQRACARASGFYLLEDGTVRPNRKRSNESGNYHRGGGRPRGPFHGGGRGHDGRRPPPTPPRQWRDRRDCNTPRNNGGA